MDIRGEQTTAVVKGCRSADSGDSDIVLSHFLGQSRNALDDSEIQRLMEDDPAGFQDMLEVGESAIGAEQTFSQTPERMTFLSDSVQLETSGRTSTLLKREMRATEKGRKWEHGR